MTTDAVTEEYLELAGAGRVHLLRVGEGSALASQAAPALQPLGVTADS
ncbi:MAG: hypothetical protein J2P29_07520 [Actinobacteria bacterium]|nr:hypothetical protein [Actinomycetota bacterium]